MLNSCGRDLKDVDLVFLSLTRVKFAFRKAPSPLVLDGFDLIHDSWNPLSLAACVEFSIG
ncbi:hypothetical protein HK098_008244, partial [Nowakowskiella sp. JEL0407]